MITEIIVKRGDPWMEKESEEEILNRRLLVAVVSQQKGERPQQSRKYGRYISCVAVLSLSISTLFHSCAS